VPPTWLPAAISTITEVQQRLHAAMLDGCVLLPMPLRESMNLAVNVFIGRQAGKK
jgi:hypothetical protein